MEEKKTLNMDTFNEILITALKDQSPKGVMELYMDEMGIICEMELAAVTAYLEAQDGNAPATAKKLLRELRNIDGNRLAMQAKMEALAEEHPELNENWPGLFEDAEEA